MTEYQYASLAFNHWCHVRLDVRSVCGVYRLWLRMSGGEIAVHAR
jgi:hypothetical protein